MERRRHSLMYIVAMRINLFSLRRSLASLHGSHTIIVVTDKVAHRILNTVVFVWHFYFGEKKSNLVGSI